MTGPFLLIVLVFIHYGTLFVFFGSVWQTKLAVRQLLDAHKFKYSLSYRLVSNGQSILKIGRQLGICGQLQSK